MPVDGESRATFIRSRTRGGLLVQVSGTIDETFNSDELVAGAAEIMVVDLGGVRRITSFGIRAWVRALERLHVSYLCLTECPPQIVAQLNMVAGFAGKGEVVSFRAPYFCPACEELTSSLFDLRRVDHQQAVNSMDLAEPDCPSCGETCEFDDIAEIFLQYFRATPIPNPPALANALIDGREVGQSFVIEKQIAGQVTGLWMWGAMDRPQYFRHLADGLQGLVVVVLADVEGAADKAFTAFIGFLHACIAEVYLARVPHHLLSRLVRTSKDIGSARVVSVMLPFYCATCRRTSELEVPASVLAEPNGFFSFQGYCPECVHAAQPRISGDVLQAGQRLSIVKPPMSVRDYLVERSSGPSPAPDSWDDETVENPLAKYRIEQYLGSGGMGDVYRARHVGIAGFQKVVVVKRIRSERLGDKRAVERFLQEARLSARLSHPNLVQIFDLGRMEGSYFLTMEYVDGPDLDTVLNLCRKLQVSIPIELCLRVASDVCQGLHAAHNYKNEAGVLEPIIHCDVTPGNVLISSGGVVKLTDFGIAKLHDAEADGNSEDLQGTYGFVAPELLIGSSATSVRPSIDVYGVGVLLFECLSGTRLFDGQNWHEIRTAILERSIPRLSNYRIGISPHLERSFARAVERNPNKRYSDVRSLQRDIDIAIDELKRPASTQHVADWLQSILARRDDVGEPGDADTMNDLSRETTGLIDRFDE